MAIRAPRKQAVQNRCLVAKQDTVFLCAANFVHARHRPASVGLTCHKNLAFALNAFTWDGSRLKISHVMNSRA